VVGSGYVCGDCDPALWWKGFGFRACFVARRIMRKSLVDQKYSPSGKVLTPARKNEKSSSRDGQDNTHMFYRLGSLLSINPLFCSYIDRISITAHGQRNKYDQRGVSGKRLKTASNSGSRVHSLGSCNPQPYSKLNSLVQTQSTGPRQG